MGFFYFLGKKKFYLHLLIAIVVTVIIFWATLEALSVYTRHGEVYLVPDFSGKTVKELQEKGYNEYFDLLVIDSVYDRHNNKGDIVLQNPASGSKVKKGRHVYLTVVAQAPEKVTMPNLRNLSLRQALVTLDGKGLRVGKLEFVDYFARNAVVDQLLSGEPVETGTELPIGTVIDLVVGIGKSKVGVNIPFLIGKKSIDARGELHFASLNVGKEYFLDGNDTTHARVFKTEPTFTKNEEVPLGTAINLWYRSDQLFDFDAYIRQLLSDTLQGDTTNNNQ